MNVDLKTETQRDALTATATGTIKIHAPTVAGAVNFTPMAGAIVKVNHFPLVAGTDWTAETQPKCRYALSREAASTVRSSRFSP